MLKRTADGSVLPKTDAVTCSGPTSLTPPASPLDPNSTDVVTGPGNLPPTSNLSSVGVIDKKKLTQSLVQEVWQEITVTKPAAKYVNLQTLIPVDKGWK